MTIELVPIAKLQCDPNNPRTEFSEQSMQQMAASIATHGVKVPLIGYVVSGGIMLGDGHCRLEAAKHIGLAELPVIVLTEKPTEAELLATQLTINGHRNELNPIDEYEAFARLSSLNGWSPSELAAALAVSNTEVSRVMAIGKLTDEERQLVREGKISKSAAYALARVGSEQRAALARKAAAGEITRDELNRHAKKKPKTNGSVTKKVSCQLPHATVSVQAKNGLNLPSLIDLLEDLLKECRKAKNQGLDIKTAVSILRDRSRVQAAT